MFYQPLLYGYSDCSFPFLCPISVLDDIEHAYTEEMPRRGCKEEFIKLVEILSQRSRTNFPIARTPIQAKLLFNGIMEAVHYYG